MVNNKITKFFIREYRSTVVATGAMYGADRRDSRELALDAYDAMARASACSTSR